MAYPSPRQLQLRRGNTAQISSYTGPIGEIIINTETWALYIQDGTTVGGHLVGSGGGTVYSNANVLSYLTSFNGNIIPSANVAYTLGNITHQWKDLFVSNNTIYIGGVPLGISASGNLTVNGNTIPTVAYVNQQVANVQVDLSSYALNANVTAANVGLKGYVDSQISNLIGGAPGILDTLGEIAASINDDANVYASLVASIGSSNVGLKGYVDQANTIQNEQLTQANLGMIGYVDNAVSTIVIPVTYSNVNVKAYTETMGFVNYSNVNVAAYITAQGLTSYSNVNVDAYTNLSTYAYSANVTAANVGMKGYVDNAVSTIVIPVTYSNVNVAAYLTTNSYLTSATANLSLYAWNGNASSGGTSYSNVNVAAYLSTATINTTGNITAQYISGNISITGNVTGTSANVTIQAGVYTSVFDNQGNVTVPQLFASGNIQTAGYIYGNGAFLTGIVTSGVGTNYSNVNVQAYTETMGFTNYSNVNVAAYLNTQGYNLYSNANVASYLPTYSGNIANVRLSSSGVLTFPDGSQQITAAFGGGSNYGNANVAAYLPTYTGTTGITQVGTLATLNVTGNTTVGNLVGTESNTRIIANTYVSTFDIYGNVSFPGNVIAPTFVGSGSLLSGVATKTTGSWTVTAGTNNYSFTVPANNSYQLWVRGNIPNGIIVYNATVSVSNTNVPVIGQQFAWNYEGAGNPILITSIPAQIIGTAGTISNANPSVGTTTNEFVFGISNTSGSSQVVYWGYVTL